MIQKLKTYLLFGTTYCGIEHTSKRTLEAIVLQKKKDQLEIDDSFSEKSIQEIAQKLPKKQHAFLVANTDDVLSKCIESSEKESNRLLFNAFPNLTINDFYYEINSSNNVHLISICRKSIVDTLIAEYKKHSITIIGFSLGNTIISTVSDFIDKTIFYTSNALITKENEEIAKIDFLDNVPKQSYEINGITVDNTKLLAFSGSLAAVLQTKKTISNFEETEVNLLQNFKQQRFFSQFFIFGLGFILTILLVNFYVFNSYYSEVEIMKETSQVNSNQKEKLLQLKLATDEKQKTVDDILKNAASRSSYYMDNISLSMPNTIQLAELIYQPIPKRIKKGKRVEIQKNSILISGISTDSDEFSDWRRILEDFDWIENVTVVSYGSISKNTTDFSLKIKMSYE